MEFLEMPLIDDDFVKLLVRFAVNLLFLFILVRYIYYPITRKKDYLFTYFMINILIFFISFTLKKFDLGVGMALGLFAIFGIIRYRTDAIPIKEMTYLFIVIGLSVINALANKKMSYLELLFTNVAILVMAYGLEHIRLYRTETKKTINYEKINLISPSRMPDLIDDLQKRTGLKINRVEIGQIDFLKDTASMDIYYYADEQAGQEGQI